MKYFGILLAIVTSSTFAQVKTTTQDGDFWNPFVWDCTCLPADGDSLVINHDLNLSSGIAYTMGQIYISGTGSLDQGTNNFSFYINGGSLINDGTLSIDNLLLDQTGFIENHGTANLDSVWTRSTTTNTGTMNTDAFAHDENATFTNSGTVDCTNNFANQGVFINSGLFTVGGNASNCNIQTSQCTFDNDGIWCITGTFLNCADDTLRGSGQLYIGGNSTNDGEVEETLVVNTSTGGFTINIGNVAGTVSFGTAACGIGFEEGDLDAADEWIIFPNPATTVINSSEINVNYQIYDLAGKRVVHGTTFNGVIHIATLTEGTYIIELENSDNQSTRKTFVKL